MSLPIDSNPYHITLPSWTEGLPDHASLTTKDMALLLGYKLATTVVSSTRRKRELPPSGTRNGSYSYGRQSRYFWTLGDLRKYIQEVGSIETNKH